MSNTLNKASEIDYEAVITKYLDSTPLGMECRALTEKCKQLAGLIYEEMYGEYQLLFTLLPKEFLRKSNYLTISHQGKTCSFMLEKEVYIPYSVGEYQGDEKLFTTFYTTQNSLFKLNREYDEEFDEIYNEIKHLNVLPSYLKGAVYATDQ